MAEQKKPQESEELVQKADAAVETEGEASEEDLDAVAGGSAAGEAFLSAMREYTKQGYSFGDAFDLVLRDVRNK